MGRLFFKYPVYTYYYYKTDHKNFLKVITNIFPNLVPLLSRVQLLLSFFLARFETSQNPRLLKQLIFFQNCKLIGVRFWSRASSVISKQLIVTGQY